MNELATPRHATTAVTFVPEDRCFVYAVVRRIVSEADADDVTQDALLLAYRYRNTFRGDSRYRTWLYRIATTTALGHLRRQRRAAALAAAVANDYGRDAGPAEPVLPSSAVEAAEMAAVVHQLVNELAPPYRDVVLARADASEHEVAEQLGISVANVKIRAHRARKYLRESMSRIERSAA